MEILRAENRGLKRELNAVRREKNALRETVKLQRRILEGGAR